MVVHEDAAGYFLLVRLIAESHGLPLAPRSDRHTIFCSPIADSQAGDIVKQVRSNGLAADGWLVRSSFEQHVDVNSNRPRPDNSRTIRQTEYLGANGETKQGRGLTQCRPCPKQKCASQPSDIMLNKL